MIQAPSTLVQSFLLSVSPLLDRLPVTNASGFLYDNGVQRDQVMGLYVLSLRHKHPISNDLRELYVGTEKVSDGKSCREALDRIVKGLSQLQQQEDQSARASAPPPTPVPASLSSPRPEASPAGSETPATRVTWALTYAIPRKDEIDGSVADVVQSLARRPIEEQHDFWKTLLSQPNMLRQLRGINFRGRGGDPKKNPSVEAVNRAVVSGFFRFVREFWRGGTRRLTSPLITHDALSWLAKTQIVAPRLSEMAKQPQEHGRMLGLFLVSDHVKSPLNETLLDCLKPLDPDRPRSFFLDEGMAPELGVIREIFLFVAYSAEDEPERNWPLVAAFWEEVLKFFLDRQEETAKIGGVFFYKLLRLIADARPRA